MSIKICSFNVKNLADGEGRDIERIAKIINDNHFDIVCLQEVLQEGKILSGITVKELSGQAKAYDRSLKSKLKGTWDSEWQQPKLRKNMEAYLGGDKRGEGYAILWRTDNNKLTLLRDEYGNEIRPRIFSNYDTRIVGSKLRLIRDPLYARFKVGNRPAELRLITTHIIYGKSDAVKDILDYGAMEMRRKEFDMLAGQIYYRVSEMYKDSYGTSPECTSPYTIMMGDYNLNLGTSLPFTRCFDKKGHVVSEDDSFFKVTNLQQKKTTLKRDSAELANSYDHFTVDDRAKGRLVSNSCGVVDAIHKYKKGTDASEEDAFYTYREKVSDHLPIAISINI